MKMFLTNIAQRPESIQSQAIQSPNNTPAARPKVYEYALRVFNFAERDLQELTAAFVGQPSNEDWHNWLQGWNSCGYHLLEKPTLINIIP